MANIRRTPPHLTDDRLAAMLHVNVWNAQTLFYSFPDSRSDYGKNYGVAGSPDADTMSPLSALQRRAVAQALDEDAAGLPAAARAFTVEGFTTLDLAYSRASTAEIRVANVSQKLVPTAYAFKPFAFDEGGDAWFGGSGRRPLVGAYDNLAVLHELGHALGLKHPHDRDFGRPTLSRSLDGLEHTVMSYRSQVGDDGFLQEAWGSPQTFMALDIAALQEVYGADYGANAGATVYRWTPGSGDTFINGTAAVEPGANRIFLTIWDGGGVDTYDLRAYRTDLSISLAPGDHSRFSLAQSAILDAEDRERARGNVFNALLHDGDERSLIENAFGGVGDDIIVGNAAANLLVGGDGDDTLNGGNGDDRLAGGAGDDALAGDGDDDRIAGGDGNDKLWGGSGYDRLDGGAGDDRLSDHAGGGLLSGGEGNDFLSGKSGGYRFLGGAGDDRLSALSASGAVINGGAGNDAMTSGRGDDLLLGGLGSDYLYGSYGRDRLEGGADDDRVIGGAGHDLIDGGAGADVLSGGQENDLFILRTVAWSRPGSADRIVDGGGGEAFDNPGRAGGDRISLQEVDANIRAAGDQAFVFAPGYDEAWLSQAGRLWVADDRANTVVRGTVDGVRGHDFEIVIADGLDVTSDAYLETDFIL